MTIESVPFHRRVLQWCINCFGMTVATNKVERIDRFLEEAIELAQSLGHEKERAARVLDYVYSRPVGEPTQEVGGTLVTLGALCAANHIDMELAGEAELFRINEPAMLIKIRNKRLNKPEFGAEPVPLLPSIQEDEFLKLDDDDYAVDRTSYTSMSIGGHEGCIFILTKMKSGEPVPAGLRVVEFLRNARITK